MSNKNADLVLIQPLFKKDNRRRPPLHLMIMGTKTNNIVSTKVIDGQTLGLSVKKLADLVVSFKPIIVGISILSPTFPISVKLSKAIKSRLPGVLLIAGGKHATLETEGILDTGIFDLVIRGEADLVLPEIVQKYLSVGKNIKLLQQLLDDQPGIAFSKNIPMSTVTTQVDLKNLPPVNWEILYPELDYYLDNTASIEDQRGCIYNCSYCSASRYYQKVSFRSPKQITDDIVTLYGRGFTTFFFTGDDSFINPERTMEIFDDIVQKGLPLNLILNTRADSFMRCVDKYGSVFTSALSQAHVTALHIGVESGDKEILKQCNKMLDLEKVYETIAIANKLNIVVETNWIVGLPNDSEKSINNSINLALKLYQKSGPHFPHISYFMPYPGTKDAQTAKDYELYDPDNMNLSRLTAHDQPLIPTKYLSVNEVGSLFNKFALTFYNDNFINSLSSQDLKDRAISMRKKFIN